MAKDGGRVAGCETWSVLRDFRLAADFGTQGQSA